MNGPHKQHSAETIKEALSFIPSDERDTWVEMAMAVKSELGDSGFDVWDAWSRSSDAYKERDARSVWKSIKEGGSVTIGTLLFAAKQNGFKLNGHGKQFSPAEWERIRKEREERQRIEADRKRQAEEATSRIAEQIYKSAESATDEHPYLARKGIPAFPGLKVGRWYQVGENGQRFREKENCLLVPMRDSEGKLWNVQAIFPEHDAELERDKDYLLGGKKQGTYFAIGKPDGVVVTGEGLATMGSVRLATGCAVCVAFDKGNLSPVVRTLAAKLPGVRQIIAADNDIKEGKPNYGVIKANEAAAEVGALVAIPEMGGRKCDFNDLGKHAGHAEVKRQIEAACQPTEQAEREHPGMPEKLPELPAVPPFNYDFLPGQLRAFVQDVSERMQCPPEFAAVGVIVMAGSAIGRKVGIRPKMNDSWTVIPNLWGMLVGRSGVMKSPALAEALAPIKRMQAMAFEKYEEEEREFLLTERAAKIRAAQAENEAKKAIAKNKNADLRAMLQTDEVIEPKATRYIVNDSSPEALCETLKDNPNGVLVERDELIGLLRSMDREGNQEARALYLTAADGDKSFTVDRIMRGSGRHIEGLCVGIVGGIQPGVLASYVRETQRSGAGDDGLLQRFALMVYPDVTEEWKNIDRKPDTEARDAVKKLIEHLCTMKPEDVGAESDGYGVPFVRFGSAGYGLFVEWLTEMERKLRFGDDHPSITSHLSKYRKLVPALALINHLCEGGTGEVTEAAVSRALLFSDFLETHARRVYSYASRPDFDAAKTILAKLKAGKLKANEFTERDVYKPGWSGLTTPDEARAALKVLQDFNWISELPQISDQHGGRPSRRYTAHQIIKGSV